MSDNEKKSIKCEYCNNILSTTASLNYHKKTNKKCLSSRGNTINNKKEFKCSECGFNSEFKKNIMSHKCRQEHIEIYKKYLETEKEYKICLEKEKLNNEKLNTLEKENKIHLEKIEKLKNKNRLLKTELTEKLDKQIEKHENQLFTLASKPP